MIGQTNPDDAFIRPWAETPITVIGYELVKLQFDDPESWRRVAIAIRAGARELGHALLYLGVIAKDVVTLDWAAIAADRAATLDKIAAIQKETDERIPETRYSNDRQSWFMIGSGIHPQSDAMLWLAPGETHSVRMWPPGTGQIWPSKALALKGKHQDILDLHGVCFGGGVVKILLTIYYTPHGQAVSTHDVANSAARTDLPPVQ